MEPVEQTGPESVVFRVHRAGNPPECLPTAYKPQLITRRSLVQFQPPQPNKKGTQTGAFFIWFELASDGSQPPAGGTSASLKCGRNLRFPHKRPLPYRKKGTEQEIHNAPITRSKTDMSLWRKDYDSAAPDRSLRNELRLVPGLSGQRACLPWMRSWQRKKSLPELFNPKM